MRIAERPLAGQPAIAQPARHRLDHAEFEGLGRFERRQYAREARGQHRLARTRWANHQQIVTTCGSNFERTLGAFLALDIGKIDASRARRDETGFGRR